MEAKTLYKQNKDESIQVWIIWTEGSIIKTSFGRLNGAMQESSKEVEQKNVGRSNETSKEHQAELEAMSMWKHKKDKGYFESLDCNLKRKVSPMLAQSFEKRKHKVVYPCASQPKLDGNRMNAYWEDDRIILLSRGNKELNIKHLARQLETILPKNVVFDGEIYFHGVSLQTINSWIKKDRPESKQLEFWVYDCFEFGNEKESWTNRDKLLEELLFVDHPESPSIKLVTSQICHNEKDVYAWQTHYVSNGFEGAIIRELHAPYEVGHRSNHLLKLKNFDDHEYRIVGYTNGIGKFSNCVIWICKDNETDRTFQVTPKASREEKEEWLKDASSYLNQWLTVKHFGYTDSGLPNIAVGKGFRSEEDM